MASASPQPSFLTGNPISPIPKPTRRSLPPQLLSCRFSMEKEPDPSGRSEIKLAKLAIVTLAAGVLTVGSVHDAMAAKSGGRVGGQAFRSPAPRSSGPRINNSSIPFWTGLMYSSTHQWHHLSLVGMAMGYHSMVDGAGLLSHSLHQGPTLR
uniref:Uncharacterized protein LOC105050811 isoform X3 n=1 Tax=Elaeis guineensis var. tenera TaxID=51953 RepID=A0A6I9RMF1_ELAGV|nr:uncharacterized protein LOC105050811 isoform X3 [Elaeis guineensis]